MAGRYGLQIRAATTADAVGLAALSGAAGRPVSAVVLELRLEALSRQAGVVLLAEEWGPPSGVVALSWSHRLDASGPAARIETLLVAPDDRRRGIGRLLLKAGAQAARAAGCEALHLLAGAEDASTAAFCAANGFGRIGAVYNRPLRKRAEPGGRGPA